MFASHEAVQKCLHAPYNEILRVIRHKSKIVLLDLNDKEDWISKDHLNAVRIPSSGAQDHDGVNKSVENLSM